MHTFFFSSFFRKVCLNEHKLTFFLLLLETWNEVNKGFHGLFMAFENYHLKDIIFENMLINFLAESFMLA